MTLGPLYRAETKYFTIASQTMDTKTNQVWCNIIVLSELDLPFYKPDKVHSRLFLSDANKICISKQVQKLISHSILS